MSKGYELSGEIALKNNQYYYYLISVVYCCSYTPGNSLKSNGCNRVHFSSMAVSCLVFVLLCALLQVIGFTVYAEWNTKHFLKREHTLIRPYQSWYFIEISTIHIRVFFFFQKYFSFIGLVFSLNSFMCGHSKVNVGPQNHMQHFIHFLIKKILYLAWCIVIVSPF